MKVKLSRPSIITIVIIVALCFLFQIAHFFEHLAQAFMVIIGPDRTVLFMTPWATDLVVWFADMFQSRPMEERMLIGMEVLHFFGNLIFLTGLFLYYHVFDKSRFSKIALIAQSLHMFEHVLLTATVILFGTPLGFTTLFGAPISLSAAGLLRGTIHFVLNLIPSLYIAKALIRFFKKR